MSLQAFMAAVRRTESGDDKTGYGRVGDPIRKGRKVGAYGFASDEWDDLAGFAGIPGARWQDPRAQDYVAAKVFQALYEKYGDWRLVAAAWRAGEQAADLLSEAPDLFDAPSLKGLGGYVSQVMRDAGGLMTLSGTEEAEFSGGTPGTGPTHPFVADLTTIGPPAVGRPPANPAENLMRRRLYAIREAARARPDIQMSEPGSEPGEVSRETPEVTAVE